VPCFNQCGVDGLIVKKRPDVDIWFADESGFEGDARPRKRWDKKGRKARVTGNGGYLRINVIGMVCPRSGAFFAIEASHSDSATYQAFLDQADKNISFQGKIIRAFGPSYIRRY